MRFLSIYKTVETGARPPAECVAAMGQLVEEMMKSGALLATEGCAPSARGARVTQSAGRVTVTDGPFAEAKEVVGGFAILQASSREEAIALTKRFLSIAGDGECEIRELYEVSDCQAVGATAETAAVAR